MIRILLKTGVSYWCVNFRAPELWQRSQIRIGIYRSEVSVGRPEKCQILETWPLQRTWRLIGLHWVSWILHVFFDQCVTLIWQAMIGSVRRMINLEVWRDWSHLGMLEEPRIDIRNVNDGVTMEEIRCHHIVAIVRYFVRKLPAMHKKIYQVRGIS